MIELLDVKDVEMREFMGVRIYLDHVGEVDDEGMGFMGVVEACFM